MKDELLVVKAAEAYAETMHKDQKYGNDPYVRHLREVAMTCIRYGCKDPEMIAAAFLHDTVEDTEATVDQIKLIFGPRVADLVWRVTNEEGKNRAERHKKTYVKIKESNDALFLKLADRISNVAASIKENSKLLGMYKKEYKGFKKALYTEGVHDVMWEHLDALLGQE